MRENPEAKRVNWGLVGSVFCINQVVLPLVPWRVNSTDIIAFGQGGLVVAGLIVKGVLKKIVIPEPVEPRLAIIPPNTQIIAPTMDATKAQHEAAR